jgi:hypothetical protein
MEDFEQLKIIFNLLKKAIKYLTKHLNFVLLIPALFGGIWQIIELSQMSFSYVRFFSPSQVLADGLLILILLIFFASTFYFIYIIHHRYINSISEDNIVEDEKLLKVVSKTNYTRCAFLFLLYIILLFLEIYTLSSILGKLDSLFTILILFPVVTVILYLALGAWIFANMSIIQTWFYKNILRHTIWLWFATIGISILLTATSFRNSFALPKDLVNADIIVHQIAEVNPETQPIIVYNNDKYLFIELNNFFYHHNKPVHGGMLIVPVEDIFHLSEVKYKLPEYTKAAYHFYQSERQKKPNNKPK